MICNSYEELMETIESLDPIAATYIRENILKKTKDLDSLMIWDETPQGNQYWYSLYRKIQQIIEDPTSRVLKRCKHLWNKSNYVKKFPQQAY